MTVKFPMKGATLSVTIASVPTVIPNVKSIDDIVGIDNTMIDITYVNSTAVQNMKGLPDYGSLTFKIDYDPSDTTHLALVTQAAGSDDTTLLVTLANTAASTIQVVGPLKMVTKKGGGPNDIYRAECSLKINSLTETP